jgi:hypothetical protein
VVFLGTPHPTYRRQNQWSQQLSLILQSSLKLSKRSLVQAELEAAAVANISLKFEEAGIDVPILSAFELRESKVAIGLFQTRKVLVSKTQDLC